MLEEIENETITILLVTALWMAQSTSAQDSDNQAGENSNEQMPAMAANV